MPVVAAALGGVTGLGKEHHPGCDIRPHVARRNKDVRLAVEDIVRTPNLDSHIALMGQRAGN